MIRIMVYEMLITVGSNQIQLQEMDFMLIIIFTMSRFQIILGANAKYIYCINVYNVFDSIYVTGI